MHYTFWELKDRNLKGEWNRPEFLLENERTGEVLRFKRVRVWHQRTALLVFVLHRYSKNTQPFGYGGHGYGYEIDIERHCRHTLGLTKKKLKFFNRAA